MQGFRPFSQGLPALLGGLHARRSSTLGLSSSRRLLPPRRNSLSRLLCRKPMEESHWLNWGHSHSEPTGTWGGAQGVRSVCPHHSLRGGGFPKARPDVEADGGAGGTSWSLGGLANPGREAKMCQDSRPPFQSVEWVQVSKWSQIEGSRRVRGPQRWSHIMLSGSLLWKHSLPRPSPPALHPVPLVSCLPPGRVELHPGQLHSKTGSSHRN